MAGKVSEEPSGNFRNCLPDLSLPRFTTMKTLDCREYAQDFKDNKNPPWLHALYVHWRKLYQEPYQGVTNDGKIRDGLYELQDEGVDIEKIVNAADAFLSLASDQQQAAVSYHIDSPEWRSWSNPEFLLSDKGLRLEDLAPNLRKSVLRILEMSLSQAGYYKAVSAMRINHFLGELVDSLNIMNEYSYNFVLFGTPSTTRPWGYSFYGHHLCLNLFFYKRQIVISPWFTGAEPNEIDGGPYSGTTIMRQEEAKGLKLMQTLSPGLQQRAQIYKQMKDSEMPEGRWNRDDQRHLCGAYRDNRVVPYEGILATELAEPQQLLLWDIVDQYLLYLPETARKNRLAQVKAYKAETYFSWIGGFSDDDAFYFRIQSPVIIVEFDHHAGVFLTNEHPAKFHIHSCLRMPNGGDYGMALRRLIPCLEQIPADSIINF